MFYNYKCNKEREFFITSESFGLLNFDYMQSVENVFFTKSFGGICGRILQLLNLLFMEGHFKMGVLR